MNYQVTGKCLTAVRYLPDNNTDCGRTCAFLPGNNIDDLLLENWPFTGPNWEKNAH